MIDWNAVVAIATVSGLITGLNVFIVRAIVRDEVSKINGTYLRAAGSTLTGAEIERRLEALED